MTYALGWKTETEVFLAADTAITSESATSAFPQSSFGEKNIEEPTKIVDERGLKLFLIKNIGVTYAGNCQRAISIIKTFYAEMENCSNPKEALKWSIGMNPPRSEKKYEVVIIVAYYENNNPCLLSYNSQGNNEIIDNEVLIQVGSIDEKYKKLTEVYLGTIINKTIFQPTLHLSAMLAIFQSYSIFEPMFEHGVGGAFSGLYINNLGGKWQPDLLFVCEDKLVISCFRNDCFSVYSPQLNQVLVLISYLPPKATELLIKQGEAAREKLREINKEAKFDFVIFLDKEGGNITSVEMKRNNKHKWLYLEPFKTSKKRGGIKITLSSKLQQILEENIFFKRVAYKADI